MLKHCPICNASSSERRFFGEFCENCAGDALSRKLPSKLSLQVCKECGRVHIGRDFIAFDRFGKEELLRSLFKGYEAEPVEMRIGDSTWTARIMDGNGLAIEKQLSVDYSMTLCVSCTRRRSGYWEGMVQFRGDLKKIETLIAALERYLARRDAFISKAVKTDTGIDVFASDKRLLQAFLSGRNIKSIKSFQLHGQKGNKKIYRNTYSVLV